MKQERSTANDEFVLQPLSEATKTAFSPPRLADHDHLFLTLDPTGSKFLAEIKALVKCCHDPECRDCNGEGMKTHPYRRPSHNAGEFFDRVPERRWLGKKNPADFHKYLLAGTDFTALLIHHCWPSDRVHFRAGIGLEESAGAHDLYRLLLLRFAAQTRRAEINAEFKIRGEAPNRPDDWIESEEFPAADYQVVAAQMMMHESLGLFADRGTGKTYTSISMIDNMALKYHEAGKGMLRAIVVCPPQVCLNWQMEIERFAQTPGKVVVMRGSQPDRVRMLVEAITSEKDKWFSVVIVPYDTLYRDIDHVRLVKWDAGIADESHFFKSPYTKRWKESMAIFRESCLKRFALTGTPIGNSPMDLWSQLEWLGDGYSGFQSFKEFRKFHGKWEQTSKQGVEKLVALANVPLLQERLARLTFSITKEDAGLNLPDKVYDVHEVAMTPRQEDIYDRTANELVLEIEEKMTGEVNAMTVEHILTSLLRLAQITSGYVTWDAKQDLDTGEEITPKRIEQIEKDNPKVVAALDLLTEEGRDPLGKTIIWCVFREDIRIMDAALTAAGIDHVVYYGSTPPKLRDGYVERFNCDPDCKVFLANPQTAGEGLDLLGYDKRDPDACDTYVDHEIFFSQGWSMIQRSQAEDRAHRRGTRMPVRITDLVVPGTIDEEIRRRVASKVSNAGMVLDIHNILQNVLGMSGIERMTG